MTEPPVAVPVDSDDSSEDEAVPLQKTKSRCRRGLAARLAAKKEDSLSSDINSQKASVYSTRVASVLNKFHIPTATDVKDCTIISDEEDASPFTDKEKLNTKHKQSTSKRRTSSQCSSSTENEDNEEGEISVTEECTLPDVLSLDTMKSPSPPPPPPSGVIVKKKRPRMTRELKSAMKNISEAKSYLQISEYMDYRRQIIENSNMNSDVICLDDLADENSVLFFIRFEMSTKKYSMNKFEQFNAIFKDIARREKIDESLVLLIYNDRSICPSDSPESLNLKPADIIEFHKSTGQRVDSSFSGDSIYDNQVQLFIQSKDSKKKMEFRIDKNAPLLVLINKYSAKTNKDPSKFRLQFDGEEILKNDTADALELEDGFCLDVVFVV